jgi:hypothetical protein
MTMDLRQQQEQFSRAYVHAVATVAGFGTYRPEIDDDSIDLGIAARGGATTFKSPRVEAQLKCTSTSVRHDEAVHFPLRLKNYDDLRKNCHVPRILIVVLVPEHVPDWLAQTEEEMILKRCGYWRSLAREPAVDNTTAVTVHLPRANLFTPAALRAMMLRVGEGLEP